MFKLILLALFALPLLTLAQPAAPASGLEGSVVIGPVSGGPIRKDTPDSKPLPETDFVVKQGDKVVASFRTDAQGQFRVNLAPGHYSVVKKDKGHVGFFGPFEAEVTSGKMRSVQWKCDSGLY